MEHSRKVLLLTLRNVTLVVAIFTVNYLPKVGSHENACIKMPDHVQSYKLKTIYKEHVFCLGSNGNGLVTVERCGSGEYQKWSKIPSSDEIKNAKSNLCLISSNGTSVLQLSTCGQSNGIWNCESFSTNQAFFLFNGNFVMGHSTISIPQLDIDESIPVKLTSVNNAFAWHVDHSQGYLHFCHPKDSVQCQKPQLGISSTVEDEVKLTSDECYDIGDVVILKCNTGFVEISTLSVTERDITCLGRNMWSGNALNCEKRSCGQPKPYKHALIIGTSYVAGDVITYRCERGYATPISKFICDTAGKWVGKEPKCSATCSAKLDNLEGIITSPYYPNLYKNFMACSWTIYVPNTHKVAIWSLDFNLEPGSILSSSCFTDYIILGDWDGTEESASNNATTYCGVKGPSRWLSHTNQVLIEFYTNSDFNFRGFKLFYTAWNDSMGAPMKPPKYVIETNLTSSLSNSAYGAEIFIHSFEVMYALFIILGLIVIISILLYQAFSRVRDELRLHRSNIITPREDVERIQRRETIRRGTVVLHGGIGLEVESLSDVETNEIEATPNSSTENQKIVQSEKTNEIQATTPNSSTENQKIVDSEIVLANKTNEIEATTPNSSTENQKIVESENVLENKTNEIEATTPNSSTENLKIVESENVWANKTDEIYAKTPNSYTENLKIVESVESEDIWAKYTS